MLLYRVQMDCWMLTCKLSESCVKTFAVSKAQPIQILKEDWGNIVWKIYVKEYWSDSGGSWSSNTLGLEWCIHGSSRPLHKQTEHLKCHTNNLPNKALLLPNCNQTLTVSQCKPHVQMGFEAGRLGWWTQMLKGTLCIRIRCQGVWQKPLIFILDMNQERNGSTSQ